MSDPDELPGLAHFCEHMLFLGTEKVRIDNYQLAYIKLTLEVPVNAVKCWYQVMLYILVMSGIPWNIPWVTCIFFIYTRAFRRVYMQRKYKWRVGYYMVYHSTVQTQYDTIQYDTIRNILVIKCFRVVYRGIYGIPWVTCIKFLVPCTHL